MGKRDPPSGRHLSFPLPAQRCRRPRKGEAARLRSGAAKPAAVAEAGGEDGVEGSPLNYLLHLLMYWALPGAAGSRALFTAVFIQQTFI